MNQKYLWLSNALVLALVGCAEEGDEVVVEQGIILEEVFDEIPNNLPLPADNGLAGSYHPDGYVDLNNEFFTPQGSNGRSCASCHAPEDGWSIRPVTVNLMFLLTGGTHPIFVNNLDTDTPTCDMSTFAKRWNCTTMLRAGLFTRKVSVPATRDYDVVAANDPFGVGTTSSLWFFRRPLPTANFKSHTVMWDAANTVGTSLHDGLTRQAAGNITGAQQGTPPADPVIVEAIVQYEKAMAHAATHLNGAGSLTAQGAKGGPEYAYEQPLVDGRFDLFDAWKNVGSPHRKAVYRGQELFNNVNAASGRTCRGCHNAANSGQNVAGALFDVGASRPEFGPGKAVYTFKRRSDGAELRTTDPGRGIRTGNFADLNKFKTPTLRGLSARAPYFHNGIAKDLRAVVKHYEDALGFNFTKQEEDDLVAFMNAL